MTSRRADQTIQGVELERAEQTISARINQGPALPGEQGEAGLGEAGHNP